MWTKSDRLCNKLSVRPILKQKIACWSCKHADRFFLSFSLSRETCFCRQERKTKRASIHTFFCGRFCFSCDRGVSRSVSCWSTDIPRVCICSQTNYSICEARGRYEGKKGREGNLTPPYIFRTEGWLKAKTKGLKKLVSNGEQTRAVTYVSFELRFFICLLFMCTISVGDSHLRSRDKWSDLDLVFSQ